MNTEDRLVAALRARAEQVQHEDLGPVNVPDELPPGPPRWRRPALVAVAAAACTAVAATPFLLPNGGDGEDTGRHDPIAKGRGADWPVNWGVTTDVDGDGTEEQVRIRRQDAEADADVRVETQLSGNDEQVWRILPAASGLVAEPRAPDLGGAAGGDLVLTPARTPERTVVLTLSEGRLVQAQAPRQPVLTSEATPDDRLRMVLVDNERLRSVRGVDPVEDSDASGSEPIPVEVWNWRLRDTELVAKQAAPACLVGFRGLEPCEQVTDAP